MNELAPLTDDLSPSTLVALTVPASAARVIEAWAADQQVKAGHEAAHLVAAVTLGFPVVTVDLRGRSCAFAELDTDVDTVPETLTATRAFDRMVVDLAGRYGELATLGQVTTGSAADLEHATNLALLRVAAGAEPGAPLVSYRAFGGFGVFDLPTGLRDEIVACVTATLRDCADAAERIVVDHRDQVVELARVLARERRLSDDGLRRELELVGLRPAPVRV